MSPIESFAVNHPLSLLALNVFGDQIGLPIPSYPSLVLAGAFASEHGAPDPALVIAMAVVVCLVADSIWYWMGSRFGEVLTRRICRGSPKMGAAFAQGRKAYLRYGPVVLVFAKFVLAQAPSQRCWPAKWLCPNRTSSPTAFSARSFGAVALWPSAQALVGQSCMPLTA